MRQAQALKVLMGGSPVFLTGPPGAGKTYVVNGFIKLAKATGKNVAVTASTGIAATHLGGTTIHSWSGLGIKEFLSEHDKSWMSSNTRLLKRYNNTDVLVIDEISMLHGRRLDMINEACKLMRKSDKPFGGIQVVLVGDLFQLPPVSRGDNELDFAHLSGAWNELAPEVCYLGEQHRQSGDGLLDVLEAMRCNSLTNRHKQILLKRMDLNPPEKQTITRLHAHNVDVDAINQKHLVALPGKVWKFTMRSSGRKAKVEQLMHSVLAPEVLELKTGAEVMFVANNFPKGFVNGTRGVVTGFNEDELPVVKLNNGRKSLVVEPHAWTLEEDGKVRAELAQLPLRLAWAITIHKSQGMSLDAAEMDLSKTFTPGMGYVALSRVRVLDGIYLKGINRTALTLHPDIFEFDATVKGYSSQLAKKTEDFIASKNTTAVPLKPDNKLLANLKIWRKSRSESDKVPPYIVAHDSLLEAIAANKPKSMDKLSFLPGIGPKKLEAYGQDILEIINKTSKGEYNQAKANSRG